MLNNSWNYGGVLNQNGEILIGQTGANPVAAFLTSSGNTLSYTFGPGSINIEVNTGGSFFNPLQVANGGTGQTVLTTYGVLIGEGSNNVNVTAAGTNGQVLIASSTGDPAFATISSSGGSIFFVAGYNSLNIDVNFSTNTFFNPLQVGNGGTGRTLLTTYGVLVGEGSNNVNVTAAGSNGQILIASSTGDPKFATITTSGGSLTFTFGYNSLNIDVNLSGSSFFNPLQVGNGGTGRTILTTFGVLVGEGSNNVNVTAAGTNGQLLIASSTGDPAFATITSTGNSLTFTFGYNSLNIDVNFSNNSFFNPVQVGNGGTGRTILTTFGVLIGEGSNNINVTAAGTNGQLLIAASTSDPQFATVTSSGGTITFVFGANSLNIEATFSNNTFFNPLQVSNGGTGRTILTTFGVLIGEGSNNINVTAAGTNGQLLIASSTGDPAFATITSSGNTLTFTFGPNSLNMEVNFGLNSFFNPLQVSNGGTGQTILTTFGVLIGEGSNNVNVTDPGTNGQVLIAASTADPKFATITSSSGTVTFKFGPNSLNVDVVFSASSFFNPLLVSYGGTGRTILTTFGVLIGEGSNNVNVTAAGTNGQVLIAATGADPAFAFFTSSGGTLTFKAGPNSLNIDVSGSMTIPYPILVGNGGTGRTVLTTYGVLVGEGSNNVNVTAAGTNGQVLIASTTGDPAFATISSSGGTLTFKFGPNSLDIGVNFANSFFNPLQVGNGGTGRTILTTYGVLIGEGSNRINVTAAGTNGQTLIASTTGDPKFATITSTGGTLTFTFGYNSLNMDFVSASQFVVVGAGGTGRTILTRFGVLIGEGSNAVNVSAAGTNGQVLISATTADPKFSTLTSTGGTITFVSGVNSLNIEFVSSAQFIPVSGGGTNRTVLTRFGVLIGEGSNSVNVTAAGTNGQVLIAATTADPRFARITSSGGTITFVFSANGLNIEFVSSAQFIPVSGGGTGRTILTRFGVLIGEGSNNVNVTAAGTSGQLLVASTTGDPRFSTISSTGGSLSFTVGPNSLNIDIAAPLNINFGGTDRTVLTAFGVLIGEGSNAVNVTAAGTNGQVLIASTTGDPKFSTITSTGGTITFSFGFNLLNMEAVPSGQIIPVTSGGTGRTVLTTFGVLIGEGSNNVNVTAAGTSGQVLIASTNSDPKFSTITSTGGTITFKVGANSLNMDIVVSSQIVPVAAGGTNRTVLTRFGVLIGEGSNSVNVTAAGTNGQVLIAATTADPKFATITSTGGSLSFTVGVNSLNIDIAGALNPNFGGTNRTVLTRFGVLIGEGSNSVNVTAAGTNGQVLIASSTGDPAFATITSTGGSITFVFGRNSLNMEFVASSQVVPVSAGGTGETVLTTYGVLIGEGSNPINAVTGTNGQVLIAASTADPQFSTISSTGQSILFTSGANSLNIDLAPGIGVNFGGTGETVLTAFGVLIGEGSNNVNVTAAGTNGQVLIAATGADPAFSTITSTGGSITFTFGRNSLNMEFVASSQVIPVIAGGTGETVLTTYGVLIGEGSNPVNAVTGTNGQVLIAANAADPQFSTISSTGGTLSFTVGPNSLNIDIAAALNINFGGTNRTVLTSFGVLIGEGSNSVNVTTAGTSGQTLIAATNADPKFSTITSTGGTVTFVYSANGLNLEVASFLQTIPVNFGGTGRSILTTYGVLIGEGSNPVNAVTGTNGQVLIAANGADPAFTAISSTGLSLAFSFGPNSLNIDVATALNINFGGTDRTVLTSFGVLIGEGSRAVNVTAAGTNGQTLIAATNADPKFSTITSTGGTITFVYSAGGLNLEAVSFSQAIPVNLGGTGRSILTTYGVLIGEGSNPVNAVTGTNGQLLIAGNNVDPKFSTFTSTGGTVTFTFGVNSLNMELGVSGFTFLNPWPVANGGTGRTVLTAFTVLLGGGANQIQTTAVGTNGQVLIGSSGANPQFATILSTGGTLVFTSGPGGLNMDVAPGININFGGTDRTVLTTFGVLIGEGSNAINVTAAGTNGQVLLSGNNVDPKFSTLTSSGGTITFVSGANSLNFDVILSAFTGTYPFLVNSLTGVTASTLVASVSTSFNYYSVDTTNGTVTLQFPANPPAGRSWVVKDRTGLSGLNPITITTSSGTVTFDGQTIFNLTNPFGSLQVMFNGLNPARYEIF